MPVGALSRSTPPTMMKPAFRRVSLEVGGVEPPSPGAYRGLLQVYPAFRFVGEGAADRRAFPSVSRFESPSPPGRDAELASVGYRCRGRSRRRNRGPVASSLLTQRGRNCRCRWQLRFCRIRRSAAPPATRDPDRSGRDRCTPFGSFVGRIFIPNIAATSSMVKARPASQALRLDRWRRRRVLGHPRRRAPEPGRAPPPSGRCRISARRLHPEGVRRGSRRVGGSA